MSACPYCVPGTAQCGHVVGDTYSPALNGTRVYIRVNPAAPEPPREVWIDVSHKEGSVLVGIGHALARVASLALQAGVPVATVIRAWSGVSGMPGSVADCDGIESAESLPDLVAQVLAAHVGGGRGRPAHDAADRPPVGAPLRRVPR